MAAAARPWLEDYPPTCNPTNSRKGNCHDFVSAARFRQSSHDRGGSGMAEPTSAETLGARPAFGRHMKQWRKQRGLSQLDLAVQADISQRHISFIETGRSRPGADVIHKIADALCMSSLSRVGSVVGTARRGLCGRPRTHPMECIRRYTLMRTHSRKTIPAAPGSNPSGNRVSAS